MKPNGTPYGRTPISGQGDNDTRDFESNKNRNPTRRHTVGHQLADRGATSLVIWNATKIMKLNETQCGGMPMSGRGGAVLNESRDLEFNENGENKRDAMWLDAHERAGCGGSTIPVIWNPTKTNGGDQSKNSTQVSHALRLQLGSRGHPGTPDGSPGHPRARHR